MIFFVIFRLLSGILPQFCESMFSEIDEKTQAEEIATSEVRNMYVYF